MSLPPLTLLGPVAVEWVYQLELVYSKKTVKAYKDGLRRYLKFAFTPSELADPHLFGIFVASLQSPHNAVDALREMRSQGLADQTIDLAMTGCERFVDFLVLDGLVDPVLSLGVIRPRQKRLILGREPQTVGEPPRILSSGEIRDLLEATCDESPYAPRRSQTRWPVRDCAMVSVLLWTGMTPGEFERLTVASLGVGTVLHISGEYHRKIPIREEHEDQLRRWQTERCARFGNPASGDDPLFVTNSNRRFTHSQLNYLSKGWCQDAHIHPPEGGFFRAVRRACTAEIEECGARSFEVKAWFGRSASSSGLRRNEADLFEARLRVLGLRPRLT